MKKGRLKLILRLIAMACAGLFIGYNAYLWNVQSMQGNVLPMPFGVGSAIVLSGSMEPTLSVDDMIIVTRQREYHVDDVVVYQSGNSLVVHRIVAMDGHLVTTQGDANNAPDEPMDVALVKGKVVGQIRNAGRVVRLLKSPVISYGLMALAIFLLERSFRREKQQDNDEIQKLEDEIRRLKDAQKE